MPPSPSPSSNCALPLRAAAGRVRRIVIQAPTGSGKSTQVPQMLLDEKLAEGGEVVVLQPRRLAARMLAKRVAEERNSPLGGEVGFQIRFDRVVSAKTRIRFVTEGILLRQLLENPAPARHRRDCLRRISRAPPAEHRPFPRPRPPRAGDRPARPIAHGRHVRHARCLPASPPGSSPGAKS